MLIHAGAFGFCIGNMISLGCQDTASNPQTTKKIFVLITMLIKYNNEISWCSTHIPLIETDWLSK